jgi:hypothetical protein
VPFLSTRLVTAQVADALNALASCSAIRSVKAVVMLPPTSKGAFHDGGRNFKMVIGE